MRKLWFSLFLIPSVAMGQPSPIKSDPTVQALGQMLNEAMQREANANIRAITAEHRAIAAEEQRDAALAKADKAASSAKP